MQHHQDKLARTRASILKAAETRFLETGYLTNVDDILKAADISRATLFAHFGTKDNLFRAVIREIGNRELSGILNPLISGHEFFDALRRFAETFPRAVLSDGRLAVHRLAIVEARTFPEFARNHYHEGMGRIFPVLQAFIERGQQVGSVRAGDAKIIAEQFAAALLGYRQYRALLNQTEQGGYDSQYVELAIAGLLTPAGLSRSQKRMVNTAKPTRARKKVPRRDS